MGGIIYSDEIYAEDKSKLTDEQRQRVMAHMLAHQDLEFDIHAKWAKQELGIEVSSVFCYRLYLEAIGLRDTGKLGTLLS